MEQLWGGALCPGARRDSSCVVTVPGIPSRYRGCQRKLDQLSVFLQEHSDAIVEEWGSHLATLGGALAEMADREAGSWLSALRTIAEDAGAAADAHKALSRAAMSAGLTGEEAALAYSSLRDAVLTVIVEGCQSEPARLGALVLAASHRLDKGLQWLYEEAHEAANGVAALRAPYRRLIEDSGDVIISVESDARIAYVNPRFSELTGTERGEVIGQHLSLFLTPETAVRADDSFQMAQEDGPPRDTFEVALRVKGSDQVVPLEVAGITLREHERFAGRLLVGRDITARRQVAEQLRRQNRQLAAINAVAEAIGGALELKQSMGSAVDQVARLLEVDYAGAFLVGGEAQQLNLVFQRGSATTSRLANSVVASADLTGAAIAAAEPLFMDDVRLNPDLVPAVVRDEGLRGLGVVPLKARRRPLGVLVLGYRSERRFDDGDKQLLEVIGRQIGVAMESAMLYERARRAAVTDSLTGLYDHGELWRRLEAEAARCRRYQRSLAFLLADMDDLKRVNDTFGHMTGDRVLKRVAQILTESVRSTDAAARYGGDEFAIVLPETDLERAQTVATRILRAVRQEPFRLEDGGDGPRVTVSIGVASSGGNIGAPELVQAADKAVYRAKGQGGDTMVAHGGPEEPVAPASGDPS